MSPITLDQLAQKFQQLKDDMGAGKMRHGEYDQRLARRIQELRDRKIDADRGAIRQKLAELLAHGVITPSVKDHVEKRLGL